MARRASVVLMLLAVGAGAALYFSVRGRGFSARAQPGRLESVIAGTVRGLAIPAHARKTTNPEPATAEIVDEAMAHFADHCAFCHGNDGSGQTEIGRGLYPKPPDMRLAATQQLTDGELFYIIENGVPLTGMPAFGTGGKEGETASWRLVHFIRRLPRLTNEDLERMRELNPISAEERRERHDEQEFLRGKDKPPPKAPAPRHKHPGGTE